MTSDENVFNRKVLCLVETDDSDIKIVLIRGQMQKLHTKLCAAALHGRIIRTGVQIIRTGAEKLNLSDAGFWLTLMVRTLGCA